MEPDNKTITICMGSSCFSRGNKTNLKIIQNYLKENRLPIKVHLSGSLCKEMCRKGPVIFLDDQMHTNVQQSDLPDLLAAFCEKEK
ncbi:MAG: (2Fe-2S) ferredoxin domain-containing protein [Spirochaetales bacterium]|nr:(2Fe-2S) ferredoxin domain-containing protein [Spirochaetales bacterium]